MALFGLLFLPFFEVRDGVWLGGVSGCSFGLSCFAEMLVSECVKGYISERSMMCPSCLSCLRRACSSGLRFYFLKTLMLLAMSSA